MYLHIKTYVHAHEAGFNISVWIGVQTCVHCLGVEKCMFLFPKIAT